MSDHMGSSAAISSDQVNVCPFFWYLKLYDVLFRRGCGSIGRTSWNIGGSIGGSYSLHAEASGQDTEPQIALKWMCMNELHLDPDEYEVWMFFEWLED